MEVVIVIGGYIVTLSQIPTEMLVAHYSIKSFLLPQSENTSVLLHTDFSWFFFFGLLISLSLNAVVSRRSRQIIHLILLPTLTDCQQRFFCYLFKCLFGAILMTVAKWEGKYTI